MSVSTVGGAINENSGGMRCARYGVVKDWILKLDVVLADGSETTFGEAIYKNRGGFNIIDLIAGSEGTLCIVKKAWLKIIAMPKNLPHCRIL
ncbi:FAD-binding protein [Acidiplasma cupricumulans]|uniref:FAD-binding oxidoreductase n=1 Tax=Acidiplasma cupricumulans TaxID=312540 RepID=UPI0007834664|nr:FAD-binding protein [Acidiplasma cupricumulans]